MKRHVVLGVTGSIAAYKAAILTSLLTKNDIEVKVIMTKSGTEFITPLTFETLSKAPVSYDMFKREQLYDVEHISLARWADMFIVAPASANFLGKYANGIADDMLTTTVLATKAPVLISPAMNTAMYQHPATQSNISTLKGRGVMFIEPADGLLACGEVGVGRMEEPENIFAFVKSFFAKSEELTGRTLLVTAGATKESVDPVRYITNRSTGKMGVAIAEEAARRGAKVYLIAGDVNFDKSTGDIEHIHVVTTHDMCNAVHNVIENCDAFISAAAPCDFTPVAYSDKKIKKNGTNNLVLELKPTEDILSSVSENKGKRIHIGFAAETNDCAENARSKLVRKNLDAIALNDVLQEGCGFGVDTNNVTLYMCDGSRYESGLMSKHDVARWLIDKLIGMLDIR